MTQSLPKVFNKVIFISSLKMCDKCMKQTKKWALFIYVSGIICRYFRSFSVIF
jgi:hypothetical protein